ncbi:MAG: flexitail domain-containing putative surface protein [Phycisphaeraceae bacterium]
MRIRTTRAPFTSVLALAALLSISCATSAIAHPGGHSGDGRDDSVGELLVTAIPSGAEPGAYAMCRGTVEVNADNGNSVVSRLFCMIDAYEPIVLNQFVAVNPQEAGASLNPPVQSTSFCPPAPISQCGDGVEGSPPPVEWSWPGVPAPRPPASGLFADVDSTHVVLSGPGNFYDPDHGGPDGEVHIQGCYGVLEQEFVGPYMYAKAILPVDQTQPTAAGTVDLWIGRSDCSEPSGDPPLPPFGFADAGFTLTEWDHTTGMPPAQQYDYDRDGCSETQELRNTPATGGLRDPFNPWDLFDVPTPASGKLQRDRAVSGSDISAIVGRFGATDTMAGDFDRYSDVSLEPNPAILPPGARANYHPAYDRGGSLIGSNPWNLRPPNGAISGGDIAAVVVQFGHNCLAS